MVLDISLEKKDGSVWRGRAMRDFVITGKQPAQLLRLNIRVDNEPLWELRGDGVVISTPAGAGEYASRVGGVWMDPCSDLVMVTPICCHNMSIRPVILSRKRNIEIDLCMRSRGGAQIVIDGHCTIPFQQGMRLNVVVLEEKSTEIQLHDLHLISCSV